MSKLENTTFKNIIKLAWPVITEMLSHGRLIDLVIRYATIILGTLVMVTTSDAVGEIILNLFDGFISKANAETITNLNEGLQGQNIISQAFDFIFTLSALIAFFWSFSVSLHGTSPNSRKTADGYAKLFMGLIIGSAKNALGL